MLTIFLSLSPHLLVSPLPWSLQDSQVFPASQGLPAEEEDQVWMDFRVSLDSQDPRYLLEMPLGNAGPFLINKEE